MPTTDNRSTFRNTTAMRVADYIWKSLAARGVSHVFLVTGGDTM